MILYFHYFRYVWVYMLGTPKDCEDYVFTVKIISPDKVCFVYKLRVLDYDFIMITKID